ncbi:MAG: gamma-glutamylcyclotransferase family protein [Prochloraceae cyanobacterium]|nr:gamma-glutamylcyclotransferase family protein [Prochloraceae cyanobacterium]
MRQENSKNPVTEITDLKNLDYVWNFAYGSNMHPEKRTQRGEILVSKSIRGVLLNWRLVFNLPGIGFIEPAYASVQPEWDGKVHGVLLRLDQQEFQKLIRSEGGNAYYELIQCPIHTYDGKIVEAFLFKTRADKATKHDIIPSKRYMDLIRQGAKLSELDSEYCEWLSSLPHRDASPLISLAGSLLIEFLLQCNYIQLTFLSKSYVKMLQWCEFHLSQPGIIIAQSILLIPVIIIALIWRRVRYCKTRIKQWF